MSRMSIEDFNRLWDEAIRRHVADGGLIGRQDDPAMVKAGQILADHLKLQVQKQQELDAQRRERERIEALSAKDIMAEWEDDIPRLQGGDHRMLGAGWGRQSMKQAQRYGAELRPPTPGSPQPQFHFQCYQCGRPITIEGKDHAGRTECDLTLVDNEMITAGSYWTDHHPKPWHGEEEDDDEVSA